MFNGKSLSAPQFSHCHSSEQMNWSCFRDLAYVYTYISNDVFFGKLGAVSSSSITTSPHLRCFVRGPEAPESSIQSNYNPNIWRNALQSFAFLANADPFKFVRLWIIYTCYSQKPVAAEMLNLRLFILSPFQIAIKYVNTVGPKKRDPRL